MTADVNLSIGEKIKQIRKAKGLSIENLASVAKCSNATISRIENGQGEYSHEMLEAIKKYMGIEGAPLLEDERIIYKDRLKIWNDLLNDDRVSDARHMQTELFPISELPFERDLILRHSMLCLRILFRDGGPFPSEERLNEIEEHLNEATAYTDAAGDESLYLYYCNKGLLCRFRNDSDNALKYYFKAKGYVTNPDTILLMNIGYLYFKASQPYIALIYFERADSAYTFGRMHAAKANLDNLLGLCYLFLGKYRRAKSLYEKALVQARSTNNGQEMGIALSSLAITNLFMGNYEESIKFCDQAMEHWDHLAPNTRGNAYLYKAFSLYHLKKYAECEDELKLGEAIAKTVANELFAILCESLRCFIKLAKKKDSAALDYIENVAIPYLLSNDPALKAYGLDFCDKLEAYYRKNRNTTKANAIAVISRDVYKSMVMYEDDFCD